MSSKQTIVSGIQPTGNLHLGNYLGAVKNWVELQESGKYSLYIFIADLHSLTGNMVAKERKEQVVRTAAELLAAGIDPDKTTLFVQSYVPEHTELAWVLNTVVSVAELDRMTQFKDKSEHQRKNINAGLFTYPVLQAADILLYHGSLVPVGQDQIQHVELTRDAAKLFNKKYGKYFPETKHLLTKVPKVMSLLEPNKKMSKSLGEGHVVELADSPAVIEKKLKKAVTATGGGEKAPGVVNLLMLLEHFGEKDILEGFVKAEKSGDIRYGDLKQEVGSAIGKYFSEFRKEREELLSGHDKLAEVLMKGGKKAKTTAEQTMVKVREMVGLR